MTTALLIAGGVFWLAVLMWISAMAARAVDGKRSARWIAVGIALSILPAVFSIACFTFAVSP